MSPYYTGGGGGEEGGGKEGGGEREGNLLLGSLDDNPCAPTTLQEIFRSGFYWECACGERRVGCCADEGREK